MAGHGRACFGAGCISEAGGDFGIVRGTLTGVTMESPDPEIAKSVRISCKLTRREF
jgi:hypothetical protein